LIENNTSVTVTPSISTDEFPMPSAILLQAQKESHRNLHPFTGDLSQEVDDYIEKIENIGSLTTEPDEVLHILLKEKLSGQAERWYKDNQDSLTTWSQLRTGFRERFQQPWLNQTLFSTLDSRKQETHESINDYYDVVCRLCRRIDPKMSKQMILHFLQKGVRDEMKTNITRLMLTENDPTPETFLKFAKIEEHIERTNQGMDHSTTYFTQPNSTYMMTSVINTSPSATKRPASILPPSKGNPPIQSSTYNYRQSDAQQSRQAGNSSQPRFINNQARTSIRPQSLYSSPCLLCGRNNHRTMECYQRKPNGCFKCGHKEHCVEECPQVFF
jgi:hypothetical protein